MPSLPCGDLRACVSAPAAPFLQCSCCLDGHESPACECSAMPLFLSNVCNNSCVLCVGFVIVLVRKGLRRIDIAIGESITQIAKLIATGSEQIQIGGNANLVTRPPKILKVSHISGTGPPSEHAQKWFSPQNFWGIHYTRSHLNTPKNIVHPKILRPNFFHPKTFGVSIIPVPI